jgi:adhesin transport system membrane fusion protein
MKLGRKINNRTTGPRANSSRHRVWLIALIVASFIVWAAFAPLDEIVRGVGTVAPTMKNQTVQNLEGGIVSQIYVTEGDVVEAGQLVAEMDKTRFQSAYQELLDQKWALSLRLTRLESEAQFETPFVPDAEIAQLAPEHAASEMQLFEARREELAQTTENLSDAVALKEQEVEMLRGMAAREAVPQIDLIRAEQALVDIRSRLVAAKAEFETSRSQEFAETLVKLRQIEEQIRAREDQLHRTDVRSPIHGVVNKVVATTIGGVVQPGDPLVEILSLDDELRVEGRVAPRDIGFVYVGMPATVKLTAFDFSIYGTLTGRVVHVGADTVIDEQQREAAPYYEVFLELDSDVLNGPSGQVEIRPGMQAQIELDSGQKTVLQYILKPLFKTTEALSER